MIDNRTQTNESSVTAEPERNTRATIETIHLDDCTSAADIERYYRMKWGVLGLLLLVPFLLWLSTLRAIAAPETIASDPTTPSETSENKTETDAATNTSTETNTYNNQREIVEVNVYLDDMLLTGLVTPQPDKPDVVETRTVTVTEYITETLVTVQPITQMVTMTEFVEIEVTRVVIEPPPQDPNDEGEGCTRFDLEVGRNQIDGTPEDGIYIMQEPSGHRLATWTAKQGWLDSGWQYNLPLSRTEVQVQVFFYPATGGGPIPLEILNPAPGSANGWLANDLCHAIEVQFPD